MRINNDISSKTTQGVYRPANRSSSNNAENPSTGLRVNRSNADAVVISTAGSQQSREAHSAEARRNVEEKIDSLVKGESSSSEIAVVLENMRRIANKAPKELVPTSENEDTSTVLQGEIGKLSNRLSTTASNLLVSEANKQAAESEIRDAEFANESSQATRDQILSQSVAALQAQTNGFNESALSRMGQ